MDSCNPNSAEKYANGRGRKTPAWVAPQVLEIFLLAAIGVIDAAMQHELAGPAFQRRQRDLRQQRDGIVIEFSRPHRIQIAEKAGGFVVRDPPHVAVRDQSFSWAGAMKRSKVRASLTTGPT
jgi:hypothetical protein